MEILIIIIIICFIIYLKTKACFFKKKLKLWFQIQPEPYDVGQVPVISVCHDRYERKVLVDENPVYLCL